MSISGTSTNFVIGTPPLAKRYSDGREEADVMWSGLRLVEQQFGEAGFNPR
jgi:hypothetical protein